MYSLRVFLWITTAVMGSYIKQEPTPSVASVSPIVSTIDPEFETRISAMKQYVDIPAITHATSMREDAFAEDEEGRFEIERSTDSDALFTSLVDRIPVRCIPFLDQLAELVDNHTDRVLDEFPRLVYSEELDGETLRNIAANIRAVVECSGSSRPYLSRLVRRIGWMRKWAWTMVVIMEHITLRPGLTFRESELLLVSVAPAMHASLHALFVLEIDFPDMFLGFQNIISTVIKFHPIYTAEDPVWFLRLTPEFQGGLSGVDSPSIYPLDVPEVDFFVADWGDELWEKISSDPRTLVIHIHQLLGSPILSRPYRPQRFEAMALMERLALAMHTIRYMKEFRPDFYEQLILAGLLDLQWSHVELPLIRAIQIASLLHDHVTIRGIMDHFGHLIRDHRVLLADMNSFDNMANRFVSLRKSEMSTRIPFHENVGQLMEEIANLTRFELAGRISLGTVPIQDVFEPLLDSLFFQGNGIFWFNGGHYLLTGSARNQPLRLAGIGRLFGLIIKAGNPWNMLGRFIYPASRSSTLFETFFFSSEILSKGFYDVFLQHSLESKYKYGTQIVEALDILGREFFVV